MVATELSNVEVWTNQFSMHRMPKVVSKERNVESKQNRELVQGVYVMARYSYGQWVNSRYQGLDRETMQAKRNEHFSNRGRIIHYDRYAYDAKLFGKTPDDPPEGYWEWKGTPFVKTGLTAFGLMAVWGWLLGAIVKGGTSRMTD